MRDAAAATILLYHIKQTRAIFFFKNTNIFCTAAHYIFARKFDEKIDNNIINKIHDYLKEKEK